MSGILRTPVAKVKNNPLSGIALGICGFYLAKKYNVTNKYHLVGIVLGSVLIGSYGSSYYKQVVSQPTAKHTK